AAGFLIELHGLVDGDGSVASPWLERARATLLALADPTEIAARGKLVGRYLIALDLYLATRFDLTILATPGHPTGHALWAATPPPDSISPSSRPPATRPATPCGPPPRPGGNPPRPSSAASPASATPTSAAPPPTCAAPRPAHARSTTPPSSARSQPSSPAPNP